MKRLSLLLVLCLLLGLTACGDAADSGISAPAAESSAEAVSATETDHAPVESAVEAPVEPSDEASTEEPTEEPAYEPTAEELAERQAIEDALNLQNMDQSWTYICSRTGAWASCMIQT